MLSCFRRCHSHFGAIAANRTASTAAGGEAVTHAPATVAARLVVPLAITCATPFTAPFTTTT